MKRKEISMVKKINEKKMSLRVKIIGLGCTAIISAIGIVAVVAYFIAGSAIEKMGFSHLESVNNIKKIQIENFFKERKGDLAVLANNPFTIKAFYELGEAFKSEGGAKSGITKGLNNEKFSSTARYRTVHDKYFPVFKHYKEKYGYYDIFLMQSDNGETFFTVAKESDFGTIANEIESSLSDVWGKAVKGEIAISDTKSYKPSNDAPAQFIAGPIKDNGKIIGVLAFQIPLDPINNIMKEREGMGESGESYLVGQDLLMRSDSYLDPKNHSVEASFKNPEKGKCDTEAVRQALQGEENTRIINDYNGNPVLSSFRPLKIDDVTWAIMSEIDLAEVEAPVVALRWWIIGIAIVITAIASILFFLIVNRSIIKPVILLREATAHLSNGDLTKSVDYTANDEIGDLAQDFNTFVKNIHSMVANIIVSSENLSQAVQQISSGNQNLSQRTSEQASSLEEVASTIEQATATINQNAENAGRAKELTDTGMAKSDEGNMVAKEAVDAINKMNESSKKVSEIISVINDLAFQTNLLALNAAVEAARAGEQGRGFAVVAGEVRNLAQRSANAASQIEELINATVKNVENSTNLVNKTGEALYEIREAATMTAQIISEIATASQEQKVGINQINSAISEMDSVTQHNASLVEETASASEEMANQAEDLMEMVKQFKINEAAIDESGLGKIKKITISSAHEKILKDDGNGNGRKKQKEGQINNEGQRDGELRRGNIKKMMEQEGFEEF